VFRAAVLAGVLAAGAPCQSFDVATIKANRVTKGTGDLHATPGTLTIRNLPLHTIIAVAYGLLPHQVAGPQWLKEERFDIVAKTGAPVSSEDEMPPMLRPLLAERFGLVTHRESREMPAYVLTVAKNGPKLEEARAGGDVPFKKANKAAARIRAPQLTMPQFAEILARRLGHPVRDDTGLTGAYRVSLEWAPETTPRKPGKPGKDRDRASIFTAIQDQMGLRLEGRKAVVEVLAIDHVLKTPEPN
jgi:uncharacterized protein (TIGR03435 family)